MLANYQNVATFAENFGQSMFANFCAEKGKNT